MAEKSFMDSISSYFSNWKDKYITNGMYSKTPSEEAMNAAKLSAVLGTLSSGYDKSLGGTGALGASIAELAKGTLANKARKDASAVAKSTDFPAKLKTAEQALLPEATATGVTEMPVPDNPEAVPTIAPVAAAPVITTPTVDAAKPVVPAVPAGTGNPLLDVYANIMMQKASADPVANAWSGDYTSVLAPTEQDALAASLLAQTNSANVNKQNATNALIQAFGGVDQAAKIAAPYNVPTTDAKGNAVWSMITNRGDMAVTGNPAPNTIKDINYPSGPEGRTTSDVYDEFGRKIKSSSGTPQKREADPTALLYKQQQNKLDALENVRKNQDLLNKGVDGNGKPYETTEVSSTVNTINANLAIADEPYRYRVSTPITRKWVGKDVSTAVTYKVPLELYKKLEAGMPISNEEDKVVKRAEIESVMGALHCTPEEAVKKLMGK